MLITVGHGTLGAEEFVSLLTEARIASVVDVRRFPGSRRHPHFGRVQLGSSLPSAGIAYRWDERLGGRRSGSDDSPHTAIRNRSFRAYADWIGSHDWQAAMADVVEQAREDRVAVMCSESVWWRCHRRFIADAAVLVHHLPTDHLMHDGRLTEHAPTDGARVEGDRLIYDAT